MMRGERAVGDDTQRAGRLDRFLGDALIGAMVLLGLVFCVGAARAQSSDCIVKELSTDFHPGGEKYSCIQCYVGEDRAFIHQH